MPSLFNIVDTPETAIPPPTTVRHLIMDAMREIGVPGAEQETLEPEDGELGLRYINRMVNAFQADRLILYTVTRQIFPLISNQQTLTIGPDGEVDRVRPIWIAAGMVTPVGDEVQIPLDIYTRAQWYAEPLKTLTQDWPRGVFYEPTNPLGTLTFWPIPTTAASVDLAIPEALAVPATLDTILAFPPGYDEAWMLNLAKRLCRPFSRPVTADLREDARAALAVVKRLNDEGPPPAISDVALTGRGGYNIRTNQTQR